MAGSSVRTVGIVGAGLVGSAWAIVFARAGVNVRAFDASEDIGGQRPRGFAQASKTWRKPAWLTAWTPYARA